MREGRGEGPRNIKEILTEMKDISETVVDLGYSAVVFNSEDIAEEVWNLEEEIDELLHELRVLAILAARNREEAEQMASILQVAAAAEKISDAAGDIVRLLEMDLGRRTFLTSLLAGADEKLRAVRISPGSSLDGRLVGELEIESETGVRIIAIRRRKRWIYEVDGDTRLKAGDYIVVRGVDDGFLELKAVAEGVRRWR
ncbi:MAG TPA: potassium transporter TrkA [Thermoplasmata archaeon]|nr:potassium transporter TrkA [Thermoplasmata archaeon]